MLHRLPGRSAGFGRRVQAGAWVDLVAHLSHPLTLLDGFLQMRHGLLAMFIGRRQRFENGVGPFRHFGAVMQDGFPVAHSSVHHHLLRVPDHRLAVILNIFRRPGLGRECPHSTTEDDSAKKLFESHQNTRPFFAGG